MGRGEKASATGFSRSEEASLRSGKYARTTACRRPPKGSERYLSRGMAEGSGVYRMGDPFCQESRHMDD